MNINWWCQIILCACLHFHSYSLNFFFLGQYWKLHVNVVFIYIFKEFMIASMLLAVVNMLQDVRSNVQFLVFKGQMFSAFIGHLILQNETIVCSWSTGKQPVVECNILEEWRSEVIDDWITLLNEDLWKLYHFKNFRVISWKMYEIDSYVVCMGEIRNLYRML